MENKDIIITLNLNLDEVNGVLTALAPYTQIAQLVETVRNQTGAQLAQLQAELAAQAEPAKEGELVD
jgi:hypothetical protein